MSASPPDDDSWKNVARDLARTITVMAVLLASVAIAVWGLSRTQPWYGLDYQVVIIAFLIGAPALQVLWRMRTRKLRFVSNSLLGLATLASIYLVAGAPFLRTTSLQYRYLFPMYGFAILIPALHRRVLRRWVPLPGGRRLVEWPDVEVVSTGCWTYHLAWATFVASLLALFSNLISDVAISSMLVGAAIFSALSGHWSLHQMSVIRFYPTGVEVLRQHYRDEDFVWKLVPSDWGMQLVGERRNEPSQLSQPMYIRWPIIPLDSIEEVRDILAAKQAREGTTDRTDEHG